MSQSGAEPFWVVKRLDQMTEAEWESLCDGCGRCCLHKLRDDETGELEFTNVACRLLDTRSCACTDYVNRTRAVPDCISLTPAALTEIDWLPPSCAYRLVADGRPLPAWHPLVTGDVDSTRKAGASVSDRVISEDDAGPLEHHIVAWPARWPKQRR
ncbi:YcgN family cysteine cluster protein [Acidiphilium sp. PA]|uniref:YcgN family cysteine cluster protein n=1 Tax=Acidiphilium sp. PA TaxID=2871705 RepID=UPI0022449CE5|nr:YcgN family cysteine cluster protein [Acidiphilium sp. PA]MCW8308151.1 YcgN family cysteine cluster protein [Acidiphilium sp. PA]